MRDIFLKGQTGLEYRPSAVFNSAESPAGELTLIQDRRRRAETALNRLKSLYLYGDTDTPEKDYILERQKILDDIQECDKKLAELKEQLSGVPDVSDEFADKASYFIMVEKLLDDSYIDYEKYISNIDANIPRNFLTTVLDTVEITNGRVSSIKFKTV